MSLRTDLIDLLVLLPGMEAADGRAALLAYLGFRDLTQTLDLHGATLRFVSRLVDAVAGEGKAGLRRFLAALQGSPFAGVERQAQLAELAAALDTLSDAAWRAEFGARTASPSPKPAPPHVGLTGPQLAHIEATLRASYNHDELRRMVRVGMGEDFDALVPDKAFTLQVFELVQWADRQGRLLELIQCAREQNAGNAELQALHAAAQAWPAPAHRAGGAATAAVAYSAPQDNEPSAPPVSGSHQVFLAYSRNDSALMHQVRSDLHAAGLRVWSAEEDLEIGSEVWEDAIEAALRAAQCVVVLMTPDAKRSKWVRREISRAERLGRRIFPVLARGDADDAVPLALETEHYVDVRTDYAGAVQGKLIPALRRYLGVVAAATRVAEETAAKVEPAVAAPPPKSTAASTPKPVDAAPPVVIPKPPAQQPDDLASLGIEWITIPAGEFIMGTDKTKDKQAQDNETPPHKLRLPAYRIARVPVTVAQFALFVAATGYKTTADKAGKAYVSIDAKDLRQNKLTNFQLRAFGN